MTATTSSDVVGRLDEALQRSTGDSVAVGLLAVDRLGELSELVGHESVAFVLEEFGDRLRAFVRRQDSLMAIEASRAVVILRGSSSPEHLALAGAKLERLFVPPVDVFGQSVRLDVHAGFVMPADGPARDVLRRAEAALRRARTARAPWQLWNEREASGAEVDLALERRIEEALEAGEFVLYHQPKVHARYGTIAGAEALLRWHDPRRGVVAPGAFIPAAERAGSIRPLTFFAVKAALGECARWHTDLGVAVNIAPTLLDDDEIVGVVRDALVLFDVAPERLTLEITESCLARDRDRAFTILSELRRSGVRVAIDDFGTGYSSFAHFRDIPADELKIDRTFVARMHTSDADARIVKSIVDIGHNFAMKAVAEGVEDAESVERLRELGCDYLQGYFIAKPMPASDFREWVDRRLGPRRAAG